MCNSHRERIIEVNLTFTIPRCIEQPIVWIALLYRRFRYGCPFRRIPLTKGKFALVDPEDYEILNKYKWHVTENGSTFYAKRNAPTRKDTTPIYMHRCILKVPPGRVVDHINHSGLDNRKANLRPASRAQNNRYSKKRKNTRSKYKGVSFYSREKQFVAKITTDGNTVTLGYFKDEILAAKAYDRAARKFHKEFACLNFPKSRGPGVNAC
ncbi:MAG: hypothetical protein JW837_19015 [Sedimentisphaerales bacterium]|nr:hypothetical protein [Sedimentisphaerales bacterium]